jgi:hypothetical protein
MQLSIPKVRPTEAVLKEADVSGVTIRWNSPSRDVTELTLSAAIIPIAKTKIAKNKNNALCCNFSYVK